MYSLILIFHVIICLILVALVLLQQGKGAEVGAAFGSGASQSVFGSSGSGSFITRATSIVAAAFFVTSIILTKIALHSKTIENNIAAVHSTSVNIKQVKTKKVNESKNHRKIV